MQVNGADALSSISAQQSQLQKASTTALSYQLKVDGDNKNAFIDKSAEAEYRGYVAGVAGLSVTEGSLISAEIHLAAKVISLTA